MKYSMATGNYVDFYLLTWKNVNGEKEQIIEQHV